LATDKSRAIPRLGDNAPLRPALHRQPVSWRRADPLTFFADKN